MVHVNKTLSNIILKLIVRCGTGNFSVHKMALHFLLAFSYVLKFSYISVFMSKGRTKCKTVHRKSWALHCTQTDMGLNPRPAN